MSKQAKAKERQEYDPRPSQKTCANCNNFAFEMGCYGGNPAYPKETNRRCAIGGFAVKKTAWCRLFTDNSTPTGIDNP